MAKVGELDDSMLMKYLSALRDIRRQRKAAFDAEDAGDKAKQIKIETEFLRRFNDRGVDSVSSREYGTAYRSTRESITIADKEIFLDHVKQNDAWELTDIRAAKKACREYREEHEDIVPGTNVSVMQTVLFRRK